jgi:hypothetical protein
MHATSTFEGPGFFPAPRSRLGVGGARLVMMHSRCAGAGRGHVLVGDRGVGDGAVGPDLLRRALGKFGPVLEGGI